MTFIPPPRASARRPVNSGLQQQEKAGLAVSQKSESKDPLAPKDFVVIPSPIRRPLGRRTQEGKDPSVTSHRGQSDGLDEKNIEAAVQKLQRHLFKAITQPGQHFSTFFFIEQKKVLIQAHEFCRKMVEAGNYEEAIKWVAKYDAVDLLCRRWLQQEGQSDWRQLDEHQHQLQANRCATYSADLSQQEKVFDGSLENMYELVSHFEKTGLSDPNHPLMKILPSHVSGKKQAFEFLQKMHTYFPMTVDTAKRFLRNSINSLIERGKIEEATEIAVAINMEPISHCIQGLLDACVENAKKYRLSERALENDKEQIKQNVQKEIQLFREECLVRVACAWIEKNDLDYARELLKTEMDEKVAAWHIERLERHRVNTATEEMRKEDPSMTAQHEKWHKTQTIEHFFDPFISSSPEERGLILFQVHEICGKLLKAGQHERAIEWVAKFEGELLDPEHPLVVGLSAKVREAQDPVGEVVRLHRLIQQQFNQKVSAEVMGKFLNDSLPSLEEVRKIRAKKLKSCCKGIQEIDITRANAFAKIEGLIALVAQSEHTLSDPEHSLVIALYNKVLEAKDPETTIETFKKLLDQHFPNRVSEGVKKVFDLQLNYERNYESEDWTEI